MRVQLFLDYSSDRFRSAEKKITRHVTSREFLKERVSSAIFLSKTWSLIRKFENSGN